MRYGRIRDLREDAALFQKQLAKLLHCSQQTYSDYECGRVDIPTDVLLSLAEYYDTTTDYILGRTNQRENPFYDAPQKNRHYFTIEQQNCANSK